MTSPAAPVTRMNNDQSLVVAAVIPALALLFAAFWAVDTQTFTLSADWIADRARLAGACAAATGLCVLIAVQAVAMFRFVSDADRPGAGLAPPPGRGLR